MVLYRYTRHITTIVGAEHTVSIWVVNFSRGSSSHLISVMNVSFTSHPQRVAAAFQTWHPCVQCSIWCSLRTPHRDNQILSFNWRFHGNTPLNGKRWGSVLCLEWLFRSRWLYHRSVRNGDWGHLWNPPPPVSTNIVQPTGTESICMLCSTPWATQPQVTLSCSDSLLVSPIFSQSIFPLACRTEELIICWRWKPEQKRMIYLILKRENSIPLHGVCLPKCSMKSYQFKYTGMGLAVLNACPVVMQVVWWKSENFAVYCTVSHWFLILTTGYVKESMPSMV